MTLYKSIPQYDRRMGYGGKPSGYWIPLRNWKQLLSKLVKFEEFYIYKKEKMYYLTSNQ